MKDRRLTEALRHFHPPKGFKPWHGGPTILGALRGVSATVARWKPYPDRHSIWELALHSAYWNYAVERRLTDAPHGGFPLSPSDWPSPRDDGEDVSWVEDRRLVKRSHDRLLSILSGFDPDRLDDVAGSHGSTTFADLITGVVLHDTYHAGQIQLMKRFARSTGV